VRALLILAATAPVALGACNPSPTKTTITSDTAAPSVVASIVVPAASSSPAPASRLKVVTAAADTDALTLIRTARLTAKAENRVLVVYVGATWCPPCKRMKAELASGRLDDRFSRLTLLVFDADADGERLRAGGYAFQYVPYVALPGPDGRPLESGQATGKTADAWRELLGKLDAWQTAKP
jgi:thiol-disulfide isomerase/thioredoxin